MYLYYINVCKYRSQKPGYIIQTTRVCQLLFFKGLLPVSKPVFLMCAEVTQVPAFGRTGLLQPRKVSSPDFPAAPQRSYTKRKAWKYLQFLLLATHVLPVFCYSLVLGTKVQDSQNSLSNSLRHGLAAEAMGPPATQGSMEGAPQSQNRDENLIHKALPYLFPLTIYRSRGWHSVKRLLGPPYRNLLEIRVQSLRSSFKNL